MRLFYLVIFCVVAFAAYVRLAPTDPARWHVAPAAAAPLDLAEAGGFLAARTMAAPADTVMQAFARAALLAPHTKLIAGAPAQGLMTFETRSQIWGFPDYTTVAVDGDLLIVYGRLRFGKYDMGVNRDRVLDWLASLGPLTEPL